MTESSVAVEAGLNSLLVYSKGSRGLRGLRHVSVRLVDLLVAETIEPLIESRKSPS